MPVFVFTNQSMDTGVTGCTDSPKERAFTCVIPAISVKSPAIYVDNSGDQHAMWVCENRIPKNITVDDGFRHGLGIKYGIFAESHIFA